MKSILIFTILVFAILANDNNLKNSKFNTENRNINNILENKIENDNLINSDNSLNLKISGDTHEKN